MVIYVPGTEETDPKKQNMSLQQLGGATSTLQTSVAANTASIATLTTAGATYVVGPATATDNALVRYDATTGKLVQNSEITLGDSDGKLTRAAGISVAGTNTNDNAAAGYVGEFISSNVASGVTMASGVIKDITSISLTAGDWDVWGNVLTVPAAGTTTSRVIAWINTTSASAPAPSNGGAYIDLSITVAAGQISVTPIGMMRISLAATTTVYLTADFFFAVSTLTAGGFIGARRVR